MNAAYYESQLISTLATMLFNRAMTDYEFRKDAVPAYTLAQAYHNQCADFCNKLGKLMDDEYATNSDVADVRGDLRELKNG